MTMRICRFGIMAAACAAAIVAAAAHAQDAGSDGGGGVPPPQSTSSAGHGSVSVAYSRAFYHGDYGGPAGINSGQVQFQSASLEVDYFVTDHWQIRASIPFVRGKSDGLQVHPQLPCPPPGGTLANCVPTHVDDGHYHGSWVDWDLGVSYNFEFGNHYEAAPTLDIYIPSHNYPYYGGAVAGERVTHYGVGIQLQHQFDFSNFYYTLQYQYVVKPVIMGFNSNYNELAADLGYFISPKVDLRLITDTKIGKGLTDEELNASIATPEGPNFSQSPIWPLHDKVRKQDHVNVGLGIDCNLGKNDSLTFVLMRSVWGESNARLQNGETVEYTRHF